MATLRRVVAARALAIDPEAPKFDEQLLRALLPDIGREDATQFPAEYGAALATLAWSAYDRHALRLAHLAVALDLHEVAVRLARLAFDLESEFSADLLLAGAALAANPSLSDDLRASIKEIGNDFLLSDRQRDVLELSFDPDYGDDLTPGARAYRASRWPGFGEPGALRPVVLVDDDSRPRTYQGWLVLSELALAGFDLRRVTREAASRLDQRWLSPDRIVLTWHDRAPFPGRSVHVGGARSEYELVYSTVTEAVAVSGSKALDPSVRLVEAPDPTAHDHPPAIDLATVRNARASRKVQVSAFHELIRDHKTLTAAAERHGAQEAFDEAFRAARRWLAEHPTVAASEDEIDEVVSVAVRAALNELLPPLNDMTA